jgi:adenylate cyclase
VLGDAVNLASRLEGQTKSYGVPIVIGSKTAQVVQEKFAVLELDSIAVKGKTEAETVYAVLGREEVARSESFGRIHRTFSEMLARYRQRDFAGAAAAVIRCRDADDGFGLEYLLNLYASRIRAFQNNPPPADWNGVFVLETK